MSIYGAMFSGVSGLNAQSQALGAIADNISNVNTVGYKHTDTHFQTLVTQSATTSYYTPGGVSSLPRALVDRQGLLQASNSPTDLSISGSGFFVVQDLADDGNPNASISYTRAGSFVTDENGDLRNAAGFYLQGWPIPDDGSAPVTSPSNLDLLQTVNVSSLTGKAQPTTELVFQANLQSSATPGTTAYAVGDMAAGNITPMFEQSVQLFDSLGGVRTLTYGFYRENVTPTATNTWHVEVYVSPPTDADPTAHPNGLVDSGNMVFNTDGTLDAANTTLNHANAIPTGTPLQIQWEPTLGIDDSFLSTNFGSDGQADGFTQFDAPSVLVSADANGSVFGSLAGVRVDEDGTVVALFDNGTRQDIYKLPVAMFNNPSGLISKSGNIWIESEDSGTVILQQASQGGAGDIAPGTLEASTVDLATEFTKMISTQQAYSAASRIITTADEMLDELLRLKR